MRLPEGDQTGWPTLESSGVPSSCCTVKLGMSSTKMAGARLPVYSSPQSSCRRQFHQVRKLKSAALQVLVILLLVVYSFSHNSLHQPYYMCYRMLMTLQLARQLMVTGVMKQAAVPQTPRLLSMSLVLPLGSCLCCLLRCLKKAWCMPEKPTQVSRRL